jgi:hypothetical protein
MRVGDRNLGMSGGGLPTSGRRVRSGSADVCSLGMCRCNSRTSISARVPAASAWALRAAAHQASWTRVNLPAARACSNALAPASAPGLPSKPSS